jgi:hypothetical protein
MALNKAVTRAYLEIDGEQVICDTIDIDPENDSDFVTSMTTDNEPLDVVSGNRRHRVRAEVKLRQDMDVDFHQIWEDEDNVPVEVELEGGDIYAFSYGRIASPSISARHGEAATVSLEILCWGLQKS